MHYGESKPRATNCERSPQATLAHVSRLARSGMRYFDCSGLIYRVYQQAGLLAKIGGNRTAAGYYYWFKQRGLANRHSPRAGDLVVWTHNGQISHSGIYVGGGRVISALINPWGVKKTHVNTIHARFQGLPARPLITLRRASAGAVLDNLT